MIMVTTRMNIVTRRDKQSANTGTEHGVTEWGPGTDIQSTHVIYKHTQLNS